MDHSKRLTGMPGSKSRARFAGAIAMLALAACGPTESVDPALVGSWELPIAGGRWLLSIDSDGRYAFSNEGGGAAPSHSGEFEAHDGAWTLRSTTSAVEDGGSYQISATGGLAMTGNRGLLSWSPVAAPTAVGAAPAPAREGQASLQRSIEAATQLPAAAPSPAPVSLPETIDPCLLVTAMEATELLGETVTTQRTTPQPRTQNDCRYRIASDYTRQLSVRSDNGRGIDVDRYVARLAKPESEPLRGVGDAAYISYRGATETTSADFVIGTSTFSIIVSGIPPERSLPAIRSLTAGAARRLTETQASFETPGLEHFAGTWLVQTLGENTASGYPPMVVWVEAGGRLRLQTVSAFDGVMSVDGTHWNVERIFRQAPASGEYRLRGDTVRLEGTLDATLTRVACGVRPGRVRPPYDLTRDIAGLLTGRTLARIGLSASGGGFDPALAGLWEGDGRYNGLPVEILWSSDADGRTLMALFPVIDGQLQAADGRYTLDAAPLGDFSGTYRFQGGIRDGTILLQDGDQIQQWSLYDPSVQPPYATPITGHCG